jgi:hypothetical protein
MDPLIPLPRNQVNHLPGEDIRRYTMQLPVVTMSMPAISRTYHGHPMTAVSLEFWATWYRLSGVSWVLTRSASGIRFDSSCDGRC